jgi:hypothetical protein
MVVSVRLEITVSESIDEWVDGQAGLSEEITKPEVKDV